MNPTDVTPSSMQTTIAPTTAGHGAVEIRPRKTYDHAAAATSHQPRAMPTAATVAPRTPTSENRSGEISRAAAISTIERSRRAYQGLKAYKPFTTPNLGRAGCGRHERPYSFAYSDGCQRRQPRPVPLEEGRTGVGLFDQHVELRGVPAQLPRDDG